MLFIYGRKITRFFTIIQLTRIIPIHPIRRKVTNLIVLLFMLLVLRPAQIGPFVFAAVVAEALR